MTLDDVNKILSRGEGTNIEFKQAGSGVPHSTYETIVSFSNNDGGTIVLGADDDGNVVGIVQDLITHLSSNIVTAARDRNCIDPPILLSPLIFSHPDGNIILLQIPSSSLVHKYSGKIYYRESDADIDITDDQQKLGELYIRKRNHYSESQIFPHLSSDDLRSDLFDKARRIIKGNKPAHPWVTASNDQILYESVLFRRDFQTGQQGLTLAAALIFGKDITIHNIASPYKIEILVRKKQVDRYDDRLLLRTNLIDSYEQSLEFVVKHLDDKFFEEGGQRKDLRELIFREVIGNLIVHREYMNAHSTELVIFNDKVIATNPNKALFHGPLDPRKFNPYPKNPNIRKFFLALGWADEIGSGVRNTAKYLNFYVPDAKPLFYEDRLFRTEIPLVAQTFEPFLNEIIVWLGLNQSSVNHLSIGLKSISLDSCLKDIPWDGLLLNLIPSWHNKGTNLPGLDWPQKQPFIEKVSSLAKKGINLAGGESGDFGLKLKYLLGQEPSLLKKSTYLLHKKSNYLLSILVLTSEPIKLEKLMEWIGYKNRNTFRENYLDPLQQMDLVAKTNPDNPNDPEQKYMITEKGKLFLAGKELV